MIMNPKSFLSNFWGSLHIWKCKIIRQFKRKKWTFPRIVAQIVGCFNRCSYFCSK